MNSFFLFALVISLLTDAALGASDLETWLSGWNQTRLDRQKMAMLLLAGWAMINFFVSGAGYFKSSGRARSFHQMNLLWNSVNLTIAGLSYWGASGEVAASFSALESVEKIRFLEKFLLLNVGLDCAYFMTGLFLREKGRAAVDGKATQWQGYGDSLLLQAGFLFFFDIGLTLWFGALWAQIMSRVVL